MAIDWQVGVQQGLTQETAWRLNVFTYWLDYLGIPYVWTSGYRSYQEQQQLYQARLSNKYPVAKPGTSMHETGLAFDLDIPVSFDSWIAYLAPLAGLKWGGTFSRPDRVHFQLT